MNQSERAQHWSLLAQQLGAPVEPSETDGSPEPNKPLEADPSQVSAAARQGQAESTQSEPSGGEMGGGQLPQPGAAPARVPLPLRKSRSRSKPVRRRESRADWSKLAAEFGIEIPPELSLETTAASEHRVQADDQQPPEQPADAVPEPLGQSDQGAQLPAASNEFEPALGEAASLVPAETAAEPSGGVLGRDSALDADSHSAGIPQDPLLPIDDPGRQAADAEGELFGFGVAAPTEAASTADRPQELPEWLEIAALQGRTAEGEVVESAQPEAEEDAIHTEPSEQPQRPSARRGRKRRRKGRKQSASTASTDKATAGETVGDEAQQLPAPSAEGKQAEGLGVASEQAADNASESASEIESIGEDSDDESSTDQSGKQAIPHRSIPTWEEVVGVVVSANLESRGKGGRSNPGRGR